MKFTRLFFAVCTVLTFGQRPVSAFCGFFVARADTKLYNKASQVVLVRDGDRTVLTMSNDFKGDLKEFAVVIPVPTFLERDQIHVASRALIDHLDQYSAPRLVEYYDDDPCNRQVVMEMRAAAPGSGAMAKKAERDLGVTIEAKYTVGEYDILILSAKESDGLETWLKTNGYKIPDGASAVLETYIKQKMRFFVARVNLKEQAKLGYNLLRPIQVAYESPKFMLPIRLGTVNADGTQELFIYALTRKGRVETTNYRTVKLPTGMDIPEYVKPKFSDFYRDMFSTQVSKDDMRAVYLEYAWNMNSCDPCAAEPLSQAEQKELGVFWIDSLSVSPMPRRGFVDGSVFITRLHLRYDGAHFPEDLVFQETADQEFFQGRYVLRHPWTGTSACDEATAYRKQLKERRNAEAQTLANLTGWSIDDIRKEMGADAIGDATTESGSGEKWWKKLWK